MMGLANKLTLLRLLLIPVYVLLMMMEAPWALYAAVGVFFMASITDLLDGHIARSRKEVSDFGKLIDPIADKLLVCAALIMLLGRGFFDSLGWLSSLYVVIVICREFIISGVRLVALSKDGTIISAAWLGKIKTVTQITAIIWVMLDAENKIIPWFGLPYAQIVVYISLIFTVWSLIDYLVKNKHFLKFK